MFHQAVPAGPPRPQRCPRRRAVDWGEPLKPWLDTIIVSASLHLYVSQSSRGELVMGASLDPYPIHSTRSTLDFVEGLSGHLLDLFPFLGDVKILRQWAGLSDMTPDFSPIMGLTPVEGFYLDAGWGTWGFKATPVCGTRMAETIASNWIGSLLATALLSVIATFATGYFPLILIAPYCVIMTIPVSSVFNHIKQFGSAVRIGCCLTLAAVGAAAVATRTVRRCSPAREAPTRWR